MALKKTTLENLLDSKEITPVNPNIDPEYSQEGLHAEALILWLPDAKTEKTLMLGKTEGRRRRW